MENLRSLEPQAKISHSYKKKRVYIKTELSIQGFGVLSINPTVLFSSHVHIQCLFSDRPILLTDTDKIGLLLCHSHIGLICAYAQTGTFVKIVQ